MNLKTKKQQIIYAMSIGVSVSIVIMVLLLLAVDTIKKIEMIRGRD